ncbi:hypothetical protein OR16_21908 [Cupriavidus basilensis OR16]|uniref:YCII-related domain-containing protein n=1 Tax=Cupriavidus basilensis OR16 TaxID=1127483 RepID=H1S8R0_9BURK|nr:YciI family protein [Cupriavidus basilensis]EHP41102.1 hypothetical protein OR16_21908 [Cupriavidus basilensis OR16]
MSYIIRCYFRPGSAQTRLKIRPAHIRYVISRLPEIVCAGALCGEDQQPQGLFLAINCAERAQAGEFIADEPYCRAGLFERIEVDRFNQFVPHANARILHEELERALETAASATS